MKRALITGICGQDGSYLAEYLLKLGYEVWGTVRSMEACKNIFGFRRQVNMLYADLRDHTSLATAIRKAQPDELYNLAGQTFVPTSWIRAEDTLDINTGGLARILAIIETTRPSCRVYQASTSEMFGNTPGPCNEHSAMLPTSPYGISKLSSHHLCRIYRDKGLFVCSGILFNHESPRRGPEMVTRKISRAVARWSRGERVELELGNLSARRDWGFAGDYVKAMQTMLQQPEPEDFVIGTGKSYSVEDFLTIARARFSGAYSNVVVKGELVRKNEIHHLLADSRKAFEVLKWKPETSFEELVRMMVQADIDALG